MNKILKDIVSYLDHLNTDCKLNVTIHFSEEKLHWFSTESFSALLPYNAHKNLYCALVKKNNWQACAQCQKKIIKKRIDGDWFCGTCHAGVYEYVRQIVEDGTVVGFVSVSGYRRPADRDRSPEVSSWEKYLSDRDIPIKLCESTIPPLCRMFELLFTYPAEEESNDDYNKILQFINERNGRTTLEELCESLGRSKSHVSHLFNDKHGTTLRNYCNELKLKYAKKLLATTDMPITEIAFDAGYNDVSYFILLFKERYRITPLKYRKQSSAEERENKN